MLFQHSPPLFLNQIGPNKIVALTKYRIIYAFIDKPQQTLYSILVEQNPSCLQFSHQRQQALVVTQRSIEIYTCDFLHQVNLKKVLILNQENVYSVFKANTKEWQVFGQIYQYSTQNLKIHSIEQRSVEQQAPTFSFIEQFELYLNKNKNLIIYDHKKQTQHEIKWSQQTYEVREYLKNPKKNSLKLKGFKLCVPNYSGKQLTLSIKESRSQLIAPQKSQSNKKQKSSLYESKRTGSELYASAAVGPESSRITSSFSDLGLFFLLLELDSRFLMALIPPEKQYQSNIRKQSLAFSDKNSLKGESKSFGTDLKQMKTSNIETKWQIKRFTFNSSNSSEQQILYSSTYHHFHNQSLITAQEMIRKNQLSDKQAIQEGNEGEIVWILSKIQNSIIFSLIKPQSNQPLNHQQPIHSAIYDSISKPLHKQTYMISRNHIPQTSQNKTQQEFMDMLLSLNHLCKQKSTLNPLLELIEIDKNLKSNAIALTFLYYIPSNNSKTLSSIKLKATRLQDQNSKGFQTSLKHTKSTNVRSSQNMIGGKGMFSQSIEQDYIQNGQKITISNPPALFQNSAIGSSQTLSNLTPISGSQQINLTYSDDTELTSLLLSRIPSLKSPKSQTAEVDKKPQTLSGSQKYKTPTSVPDPINPLKQSRNRSELNPNSPQKISSQSKSFMQSIEQVNQNNINSYRPTPTPIKEVSEQHWNDDTYSKFQDEEVQIVEEVMEVANFDPTTHNKSFGVAASNSSRIQSQQSSKVVEKINFDISNVNHKRLMKKGSLQNYKKTAQNKKNVDVNNNKKSKNNANIKKAQGLEDSMQNQTQEKQFYEKLIDHFNSNKQFSHDGTFFGMKDSRQSSGRQFHNSKVSGDDVRRKEKMHNMIGKDISEIVNDHNLRQSADEDPYCSEEETVELGQEIEKEYSRSLIKKAQIGNQEEPAGHGLFSKHNTSVSCSEPTVILLDKLDISLDNQEGTNSQNHMSSPNSQGDLTYPNTPGFNFDFHNFDNSNLLKQPQIGIVSNDHWANFSKKWNMTTNQQYNENDEFNLKDSKVSLKGSTFMRDSRNNFVTKNQLEKLSKKVRAFCQDPDQLTWDQAREIQAKRITQLMREMFVKSQEKFNTLMKEFLSQIIRQEQARLFFAEYIRTFSGKTRDILVRLYMSLPDNQENKKWMSKALSEFKLSQVPQICLPTAKDILQIFKYLYPSVFIEDLLKPSIPLYQKLLQNYFVLERLPVEQITIEDEAIDLSHPRNMLNILLYLNQSYNLPMAQLFEVYCTELIKNDCAEIVVKMLKQEQTFDICEVSKAILQDIVENTIIEKLKESSANIQWVGKSLEILQCNISQTAYKKKSQLSILLNVIDALNLSDCLFSIDTLFKLSQIKNLFVLCNTLIRQNSVNNLKKLNFPFMYRELHEIAYEHKLKYYNQELKDLIQILCEKYFQNQQYRMAFHIIAPVIVMTKRGFIAKMLFKYMEGKLINRLSNKTFATKQQFVSAFKQFFIAVTQSQKSPKQPSIEHDKFEFDSQKSYLVNCPYFKFFGIYNDCVQSTALQEVIFVCYTDYQLASQLATYHVLQKKEWQDLSSALNEYVPKDQIKKLVAKSVFRFNSRIKISEQEEEQIEPSSSFVMKESELLHVTTSKKQDRKHIKSLQAIEFQQANNRQTSPKKLNVQRSKSDAKMPEQSQKRQLSNDPIIQSLKYQVNPESVKQALKKLYQKQESYTRTKDFLKALSIIDRQRFKVCHYEKFKTVINLELDFQVEKLLPFEFFFTQDYDKCYQLIKQNQLLKKLSIKNFWTVYIIMEIILSKGQEIAILMIEKLVSQFKSQNLRDIIDQILDKCKVSQQNLKLLAVRAQMEGENQVGKKIKQRILNKSN